MTIICLFAIKMFLSFICFTFETNVNPNLATDIEMGENQYNQWYEEYADGIPGHVYTFAERLGKCTPTVIYT